MALRFCERSLPFLLLMPSYNQAQYIVEAVESCLAQEDPDWELWILDNSTDETSEVMRRFGDPRIHFRHEPRRMDPGTCLNELLAASRGDCFSYVHSDNRLGPGYVGTLRKALEGKRRALAYCDHWVIGPGGKRQGLERRLDYDLANLLGGHGLGVPFVATSDLLEVTGGFSGDDLADDVLFCDRAWGWGTWIHVREPLMEYRIHPGSRTEAHGAQGVLTAILKAHTAALPDLETRGLRPLEAMAAKIQVLVDQLEAAAAAAWDGDGRMSPRRWWEGPPGLDPLWKAGLVRLPHFGSRTGGPPGRPVLGSGGPLWAWPGLRWRLRPLQAEIDRLEPAFRSLILGWVVLSTQAVPERPAELLVRSGDWATLWAARILQRDLGWEPSLDTSVTSPLPWCKWGRQATSTRPAGIPLDLNLGGRSLGPGLAELRVPLDQRRKEHHS